MASSKSRKKIRVNWKRFVPFLIIIALLVILGLFFLLRKDTKISGLDQSLSVSYGDTVKENICISPGRNRTVYLQKKTGSEWKTVRTYSTKGMALTEGKDGAKKAKISIRLSKEDYGKKDTSWRVAVKNSVFAKGCGSSALKVLPMNTGQDPGISGKAAIIVRMKDGRVFYGLNENSELPNASTTKIMTALLSMQALDADTKVPYTKAAANTSYRSLNASVGESYKASDLWKALLVNSSNDAAVALAEKTSGSESAFVTAMNKKAKAMGLRHTHFQNPHGLDETEHYSSCYDLAMMDRAAIKLSAYRKDIKLKSVTLNPIGKKSKSQTLYTTDRLLRENVTGFEGGKTGSTTEAGGCFVSNYKYKGTEYITVVLGSSDRWKDTKKLYKYIRDYC
ncbi:MAG: serine hydrolase [Eubacteriales bacterium]|nr:serine hydrolase [Eubacteriales bacterium]